MRDYIAIFRRNLLAPVVIAVYLLAISLLAVNQYRDAWFVSVVITINVVIGVIQEIRAKRALRKLELMSAPHARLIGKDNTVTEVLYSELQVGDIIQLLPGDELPADAMVQTSKGLEVNESMLTGESVAVEKHVSDALFAATVVTAGEATAIVTATGDETKAGAISKTLKRYTPELTPLQRLIQRAITWLTYGAVVVAGIILVAYIFTGQDAVTILRTITASAVTVIPEGLLLASSLLLAFGSLKLAQAKVLPQKLSAIEAMALLNLLAVDKTGTLTSDEVTLQTAETFSSSLSSDEIGALAALVAQETSGGNATGVAILEAYDAPTGEVQDILAFSSARKLAGIRAKVDGQLRSIIMGAPEFVSQIAKMPRKAKSQFESWASEGLRVLAIAEFDDQETELRHLKKNSGRIIGAILLQNSLREGVSDTIAFLQDRGVSIRVISGDDPRTVQYIAKAAGIHNSSSFITGMELAQLDEAAFEKAADEHTIFARVLPEQKERLIKHFRAQGLFTGMVGDGVNDALALKQADLGVAMYAGAPASRRVADLILMNNSFTSLPIGMRLGNRIMQAIEVIAVLFFHKIIFGIIVLFATIALGMIYPFAPRHNTFMNMFLVTMPTLMWTLFLPMPRRRVNPGRFWQDTLVAVAPIAIISGLTVAFTYWVMSLVYPDRPTEVVTMTVLTATFFGVYLVFLAGPMLGVVLNRVAKRARLLYLAAVIFVAMTSFSLGFIRVFFDFSLPTVWILWPAVGVIVLAAVIQWRLAERAGQKFIQDTDGSI